MEIDRLDRKILSILQRDNRIANVDLAAEVGLSPPACLKRVKRLREENVIVGDVSLINPDLAGNKLTLIVSIEMERDRADIYKRLRETLAKAPEVTQCYQISGNYDFMLIISVKDIHAYESFVDRVIHKDLNIRKFHTSIALRVEKFDTAINVDDIPQ